MVEGHLIQLTNNGDQSRTFAWVGMHAHKLYIAEGTVPAGYPEPGVDKDGRGSWPGWPLKPSAIGCAPEASSETRMRRGLRRFLRPGRQS
jgi:hypothetical protein